MQQKKIFVGGIDSDTASEMLPDGRDRYRLNVRALSSDNSTIGAIETVNGNTLVTQPVAFPLPAGRNVVIGSKEDVIRNKVYYFVFNDNGTASPNHSIYEYDTKKATNAIKLVLQNSDLGFNENYLITSINFVALDEDNHLMYWTDNYTDPKKINIEKGILHSGLVPDYINGYGNPFDIKWIYRIKQPPLQPSYSWTNDSTREVNYLFNKNFQFKSSFIYDDKEKSAFSAISSYEFPFVTWVENNADDTYTQDNQITISVFTGSSIVKKIIIAAKENNETDFVQIAELDKAELGLPDNSYTTYDFYNDGTYLPIEVNESIKLFDNVPKLVGTHDIIAGNRLADGDITEGYDPVSIDLGLDLDFQTVDNAGPTPNVPSVITTASYLKSGGRYVFGIVYYDDFNRSGTTNIVRGDYNVPNAGGVYGTALRIPFLTEAGYYPASSPVIYNSAPLVTWNVFNSPPTWATKYRILRSKNTAMKKYIQFALQTIEYYDKDGVVVDPTVSTPFGFRFSVKNITGRYKTEYPLSQLVYDFTKGDRVRFIANRIYASTPYANIPVAPHALIYAPASTTYGALPERIDLPFTDYEISGWDATNMIASVTIRKSAPIADTDVIFPGALYEIYTPGLEAEDDLNLTYEFSDEMAITTDSFGNRVHGAGTSGTAQIIVASSSNTLVPPIVADSITVPSGHGLSNGDTVKIVQSTGSFYAVINVAGATNITVTATSVITGTINSGAVSTFVIKSATGIVTSGDSFRPYQNMPFEIAPAVISGVGGTTVFRSYSHVENMNINNFFASQQHDYRRPNRVDDDFKEINRISTVVYSERFIPETNINGLSSVYDTNFETYRDSNGRISKLYAEGQNLYMFQELKISFIPVQQVIYNDLQGGNTVGASATVLSAQPIYYAGEYGIGRNPESFAVYGQSKYGIDVRRGVAWRLSIDGLTPISETGFQHNYFTDKCQIMLASTFPFPQRVYGIYDVKFNEYVMAFAPILQSEHYPAQPAETIAFNEKENQWSTHYEIFPENLCTNGINILSFKDGSLYTHNTNPLQSNFYGEQYYGEIWCILNQNPSNVKVFEALSQETNDAWECYSIITPNGQETNLLTSDFQMKENLQYAPLWRDVNTLNVTNPLLEGDPMRDTTFLCKFRRTNTDYNKIFAINLNYIVSNLHNI